MYEISTPSGSYYIGHASNLRSRAHSHFSMMQNNQHHNERVQRSWHKYNGKLKHKVLHTCATKEDAAIWEAHYLQLFYDDKRCMNAVREDFGTAGQNQTYFSKKCYVAYLPTGAIHEVDSKAYWGNAFGMKYGYQYRGTMKLVYCDNKEEAMSKIGWYAISNLRIEANRRQYTTRSSRPAHNKGKHLYFIWTKTRKWIVWGGDEAKRITSSIEGEYWVKTRTRKWKHKKPATEALPVRIYRSDRGEVLCDSMAEACRIIGCSHTDLHKVVYGKEHRLMTKGWRAELVETP